MRKTIVGLCLLFAAAAAVSQVARIGGPEPVKGELVFVGKVSSAVSGLANMSEPPRYQFSVEFTDVEMIKGDKPAKMVLTYTTTDQSAKVVTVGTKLLIKASGGRITSFTEPTDAAIAAAGGKPATTATAPATGPAGTQPATSTAPATAPAKGWTKLFEDAKWYKESQGKEEVFAGKLEAIPQADGATTLMRTSFYKLGDRTVRTRVQKVKILDGMVGKKVEIRGKAVDMALEGQSVKEIWPAAVRLAE